MAWPGLPRDFDFAYGNGAPADQQIEFPPPAFRLELFNLTEPSLTPNGTLCVELPGHRAFVLLRLHNGAMLPLPMLTDLRSEICFEHQPREYCVQAGETDLDFIARLAAEEGLLYTFEHRTDGHTLVLTDRVGGLGTIGTHTDCPVIYQPMSGGDFKEPALNRFHGYALCS